MIETPKLPYPFNALEPSISKDALETHFEKHHMRYVSQVNELVAKTDLANASLDGIIHHTARKKTTSSLFNNAAQAWNHAFFWSSMRPGGGGLPSGTIARKIDTEFRGYDDFASKFKKAAVSHFGSGWAWLVLDGNKLKVVTTKDAQTPTTKGLLPIICLDLWEHAYYLDYRSQRGAYVDTFLLSLLNWDFANENLARAITARSAADKDPSGIEPRTATPSAT